MIDKRLVWLFDYPWEPGGPDPLIPTDLYPGSRPTDELRARSVERAHRCRHGKVLMMEHGG